MRRKAKVKDTTTAERRRNRHGDRGVPPPPRFDFERLAPGTMLTDAETASVLRKARMTLEGWRQNPDHTLKWIALPNGDIRYLARDVRCYIAAGQPRRKPAAAAPLQSTRAPDQSINQKSVRRSAARDVIEAAE